MGLVVGAEDDCDVCGDFVFEVLFSDVFLRVLLEVKLVTLSDTGVKSYFQSGAQSAVDISYDELGDNDASAYEGIEKVAPMDF